MTLTNWPRQEIIDACREYHQQMLAAYGDDTGEVCEAVKQVEDPHYSHAFLLGHWAASDAEWIYDPATFRDVIYRANFLDVYHTSKSQFLDWLNTVTYTDVQTLLYSPPPDPALSPKPMTEFRSVLDYRDLMA